MFLHASCHRENVRIKNNVLWRKAYFIYENPISPLTDSNLFLVGCSLTFLIESHDYSGSTISHNNRSPLPECLFAFLE